MTMVAPYTQGALSGFGRRRKAMMRAYPRFMGQNPFTGLINWAENVAGGLPSNAPEAGGGYVVTGTNGDGSTNINYTDSSGNQGSLTVPAGVDPATYIATQTGAGTTPPIIPPGIVPSVPSWVYWAVGGVLVLVLLGYSGVGKLIPASRPSVATNYRRRHNRRRNRSRR